MVGQRLEACCHADPQRAGRAGADVVVAVRGGVVIAVEHVFDVGLGPEAVVEAEAPAPIAAEPTVEADIWVELPAVDEVKAKPARARRSRAKAQPEAEAQAEAVAQAPVEAAPVAAEPIAVSAEPAPVVVTEPAPEPAPEPTPDPAAIIAPPSQPKKGWWRR